MLTLMPKTSANNANNKTQAKILVAARISKDVQDKIDNLASILSRTRSELIELACAEISDLTPDEINKRIMRRAAKSK